MISTPYTIKPTAIASHPDGQKPLNLQHYTECTQKRGLISEWIVVNCRSVTTNEALQLLGYTAQSGGICLKGCNYQGQFKPDKPWKAEDDKKAPKYRSPLGSMTRCYPFTLTILITAMTSQL